jgi:hypothetical protein
MTDSPTDGAPETPLQRALRLKKSALEAKQKPPGSDKVRRESAAPPAGASKPWMKR